MRFPAFLLIGSLSAAAQDFPLVGKSYLFLEGGNQNSFGLLEDVSPKKAVYVQFESADVANMSWANLEGLYFNNTLDIADEIAKQFKTNTLLQVRRGSLMNDPGAAWNWEENLAITAKWSCKEALQRMVNRTGNMYSSYGMTGRVEGIEKTVKATIGDLLSETAVFDDRPDCWLERNDVSSISDLCDQKSCNWSESFFMANASCVKGWCSLASQLNEAPSGSVVLKFKFENQESFDSAKCVQTRNACPSRLLYENEEAVRVNTPSGLFILHLFPQVLWRARNTLSGGMHAGVTPVPTAEMRGLRAAALSASASNDLVTAGWRAPLVDEQVSTMISVQLRKEDILSNGDLLIQDPRSKPKWVHNPPLAPTNNVSYFTTIGSFALSEMLVRAFSYGKPRFKFLQQVSVNCGSSWASVEKKVATQLYGTAPVTEDRVNQYVPYCYESAADEATAILDGREKVRLAKYERPCVLFSGSPIKASVKRWKLNKDPLSGQPYDLSNFIWKGCPDDVTNFWMYKPSTKQYVYLNRNQILDQIATPYERCRPSVVANACRIYDWTYNYATRVTAFDKSGQIAKLADQRRKTACPDVAILKAQLAAIKDPALYPTKCSEDPYDRSIGTYPFPWAPSFPMADP